ncbi:MAG: tyrosine-type recombinase/integrase [Lentisphaerae bacterium]|nr:tyrosine-type recombinase/integrase [Lentisphaerota bacterium]
MGIEQKPGSRWWYGRWMREGRRHFACLHVEVVGSPGEAAFEQSRGAAEDAFKKAVAGVARQSRPEDLVQEIHRVRFGHRVGRIELPHLFDAWKSIPRKRQPREPYVKWAGRTFERLLEFVQAEFPRVKEMAALDKKVAEAFMRHEERRKVSPKTYNAELILLRGAFEHLREEAGMLANPFAKIVSKDRDTIHRQPFTAEEMKAILEAVKDDDLIRPLVVVGVCTAMRRGDACLLKWPAVDLKAGFIRVKTSKTGESVEIPMFPLLRDELSTRPAGKTGFVFPELAQLYQANPDGVNWRLGKAFERAGFIDTAELEERKKKDPGLSIVHRGDVHVEREPGRGLHTANVRGFHSFRVTWITIALAAGVPLEIVQRVTGHKTVDVVLKHYFRPGREDFRRTLEKAMPRLFMEPTQKALPSPKGAPAVAFEYPEASTPAAMLQTAIESLEKQTDRNWKANRDEALRALRGAAAGIEGRILHEKQAVHTKA